MIGVGYVGKLLDPEFLRDQKLHQLSLSRENGDLTRKGSLLYENFRYVDDNSGAVEVCREELQAGKNGHDLDLSKVDSDNYSTVLKDTFEHGDCKVEMYLVEDGNHGRILGAAVYKNGGAYKKDLPDIKDRIDSAMESVTDKARVP